MANTYEVCFETDEGMAMVTVVAKNRTDAAEILKLQYPDDIGSDGFITDQDGNEFAINW
jgi:di/tricarboxylate transporter